MKGRWKWLIILGFALDLFILGAIGYVYEENGAQWDSMVKMAHKIMDK